MVTLRRPHNARDRSPELSASNGVYALTNNRRPPGPWSRQTLRRKT